MRLKGGRLLAFLSPFAERGNPALQAVVESVKVPGHERSLRPPRPGNQPELSVSDLAGAIRRTLEGAFGLVRVKGEIGRVTFHANGHIYLDLKDDRRRSTP